MTNFLEKWSFKKADKPKAGARSAVDTFKARVAEQKAYLDEFERAGAAFKKWRSTWFQRAPGGFGVSIGRDAINAGDGLGYVVVETVKDVAEFLDDLSLHAENDLSFQRALEDNRKRRADLLSSAKSNAGAAAAKAGSVKHQNAESKRRGTKPKSARNGES